MVLSGLESAPFEAVELKILYLKTALLITLTSIKRVGDLEAFMPLAPATSHVILRPQLRYVPKVPTIPFQDQVVNLQVLSPEEVDPALALLCSTLLV